jgi:hypothetical protein
MAPERKVAGRTADVSLSINRYTEKVARSAGSERGLSISGTPIFREGAAAKERRRFV